MNIELEPEEVEAILQALPYCYLAYAEGVHITRPAYADALDSARDKLNQALEQQP